MEKERERERRITAMYLTAALVVHSNNPHTAQ